MEMWARNPQAARLGIVLRPADTSARRFRHDMDTDRNLLFGVLVLQADLIDTNQFVEACALWAARKTTPLAEVLVERGWLSGDDRIHVDHLVDAKLQKHGDNARAALARIPDAVRRLLADLGD